MSRRRGLGLDDLRMAADGSWLRLAPTRLGRWWVRGANTGMVLLVAGLAAVAFGPAGGIRSRGDLVFAVAVGAVVAVVAVWVFVSTWRVAGRSARRLAGLSGQASYGLAAAARVTPACESCGVRPAALTVRFPDGARFRVCADCLPEGEHAIEGAA